MSDSNKRKKKTSPDIRQYSSSRVKGNDVLIGSELAIDRLNRWASGVCLVCRCEIEPKVMEYSPTARVCKRCFELWRKFQ